ncbi:MAG TPA: 50S ribosomal protein L15 [Candidatus Saccharimonadales bacterium]|nr:50S ribosomal protein L15 [Candidatus Saccharimonadales bacterium]
MKYHELLTLKPNRRQRVGRGIAAGRGKTAGRGTKGQKSRAGSSAKPGFAGGSNPLMQMLPKLPGFKSHRQPIENVYTGQLEQFANKTIDANLLADARLISSPYVIVKLIRKGELTKKVTVKLPRASQSAIATVQAAGGSFTPISRLSRPKTSSKSKTTIKSE